MTPAASRGAAAALLGLFLPLAAGAGSDEPMDWLVRMDQALRELDYEGRFVYVHGQTIEAVHLIHTVQDGHERERLASLNDEAREVLRDDEATTCVMPETGTVSVGPRHPRRGGVILALKPEQVGEAYEARLDGVGRVAGRSAVLLSLLPRDQFRYGYRIALDNGSALPLKTALLDESGTPLAQTMFVDLRVGSEVRDMLGSEHPLVAGERSAREPAAAIEAPDSLPWAFADVPPGFRLVMAMRRALPGAGRELQHVVFSDGVASVSIYITAAGYHDLAGEAMVGPVNAFGARVGAFQATALGEVPVLTLKTFLGGLSRLPETAP